MSEISASIEETNAIRIKLGLKPLKLGPETSSAQTAEDNLRRQREEEAKKAREEAIKNKIAKSKNKRELVKSLPGKGLGEASDGEDDVDDVYKWTQRNKSKEKERQAAAAARREKELQELDEAYQAEYGEEQLSGLRVGHDLDDFGEGEERILTLKDSSILENEEEGDELINIQMSERERLEKNLENKKKKNRPVYSGFDDDEFTGKKKSLLSQYDEVLGTESGNDGFVLGKVSRGPNTGVERSGSSSGYGGLSAKEIMNQKLRESAIALTYNKTQQSGDYYTKDEADITFKKSKKKKKSRSRKADDNWADDGDENAMDIEKPKPLDISELNFVDDEDLQESLARSRRIATKKTIKKLTPEQIAKNLAESKSMDVDETSVEGGLVISDVSEFVSNLSANVIQPPAAPAPKVVSRAQSVSVDEDTSVETQDHAQDESRNGISKEGISEDASDEDINMSRSRTRAESEEQEDIEMEQETKESAAIDTPLVAEPLVSRGLGSTLALLKQQGVYETGSAEQAEKARLQAEKARLLSNIRLDEARAAKELAASKARDKEKARDKSYSSRDRERDREYENQRREQQLLDEREARMKDYKPDVNIEYIDESGNRLNTKEAFRQLSHAFHGKTSGKKKTEKRMKKIEDEKRLMGMSSTDTPLNMATKFQERQKAAGSAHIVLAVGNRNAVPSAFTSSSGGGTTSTMPSGSLSTGSSAAPTTHQSTFAEPKQSTQTNLSITGVHAPNREKVTFGLKRKAEVVPGTQTEESVSKRPKSEEN
ncbi:hypothetical protein BGZ52_007569 [Haplosporangium bisporale]|nr:hypothetical protein BGZ52_007569 [Haplosporangium bisporale]KAF9216733.1 hypothetical protein BGZ59_008342 [Podila verticillata]KFH64267.1 hypothetical protein MVEG_10092 [Podila verticillata NRRL 6337]